MELKDLKNKIDDMIEEFADIKKLLKVEEKVNEFCALEDKVESEEIWNNPNYQEIMSRYSNLKELIEKIDITEIRIEDMKEIINISCDEDSDVLNEELKDIKEIIEDLKIESMLSGEFDSNNAYMEIHSGAGGTESNDWANMIARMYMRYFDNKGFKYEIINKQEGEEVGLKGIFIYVKALYAFGYLKGETGVHRLVRISPFDSNSRRHTSFASVLVTPEIDKNINIEINEKDLKIDVYHSGGAGGQSVNTTDSAVRLTHIPTGLIVTCQNERSQIKNKEKAMEILKSRIYILEKQKFNDKLKDLKGDVMDVNFGSAIRSYVMCPYSLVKDARTNAETSNVEKTLDGDLDLFIEAYLKTEK